LSFFNNSLLDQKITNIRRRLKNSKNSPDIWSHANPMDETGTLLFKIIFGLNRLAMFTALGKKLVNYLEKVLNFFCHDRVKCIE
jgi:hypothetical protein